MADIFAGSNMQQQVLDLAAAVPAKLSWCCVTCNIRAQAVSSGDGRIQIQFSPCVSKLRSPVNPFLPSLFAGMSTLLARYHTNDTVTATLLHVVLTALPPVSWSHHSFSIFASTISVICITGMLYALSGACSYSPSTPSTCRHMAESYSMCSIYSMYIVHIFLSNSTENA